MLIARIVGVIAGMLLGVGAACAIFFAIDKLADYLFWRDVRRCYAQGAWRA